MSAICFVNNRLGWQAVELLARRGEEIAALALHPAERRRFGDEIVAAGSVPPERIFDAARLREPVVVEALAALRADVGLSVMFGYKLEREVFGMFPKGCFNLHPGLLPHGRGADPNAWAIIDREPAGATLHWIDAGIDTGDIVAQRPVAVQPTDTGEILYQRLEAACIDLLADCWPSIATGKAPRHPQGDGGSSHRRADLRGAERIDLDAHYSGRELLDRLRALTFPPHPSAFFEEDGRRIRVRVELTEDPPDSQS